MGWSLINDPFEDPAELGPEPAARDDERDALYARIEKLEAELAAMTATAERLRERARAAGSILYDL